MQHTSSDEASVAKYMKLNNCSLHKACEVLGYPYMRMYWRFRGTPRYSSPKKEIDDEVVIRVAERLRLGDSDMRVADLLGVAANRVRQIRRGEYKPEVSGASEEPFPESRVGRPRA